MKRVLILITAISLVLMALTLASCDGTTTPTPDGTVTMALSLPPGNTITTVHYDIKDSGMVSRASGNLSLPGNGAASVDVSVPAGAGYTVTMTGSTVSPVTACSGVSNAFTVTANAKVGVVVTMICGSSAITPNGEVDVTTNIINADNCPYVNANQPTGPLSQSFGNNIAFPTAFTDPDVGDTVTYLVSFTGITSGTFPIAAGNWSGGTNGSTASAYTCTVAGVGTMQLAITDNHVPSCTTTLTWPVSCVP